MTTIDHITLETADPSAATTFYENAFGLGSQVRVRASDAPTEGFRGFTVSLLVSQPSNADLLMDAALAAGATTLKPAATSLWGSAGVPRDGTGSHRLVIGGDAGSFAD